MRTQDVRADIQARLLNVREAARYLSISVFAVRQLVASGQIPSVTFFRNANGEPLKRTLIDRRQLDACLDRFVGGGR